MSAGRGFIVVALAAATLSGCADGDPFEAYVQRTDKVTVTAGNQLAANEAIQTIDPWPRYVRNTRIPGDGARMVGAINCYESRGGTSLDAASCAKSAEAATAGAGAATK